MNPRKTAAFGLALAVAAEACGIGLLGLSGWFIASCAAAGATLVGAFTYLPPSGGVQALALGRIVSTYSERVVLHAAALRRITAARLRIYDQAADGETGTWSGASLDRVMADADTVGMGLIRSVSPRVIAAATVIVGCLVVLLAGNPVAALTLAAAAGLGGWLAARSARRIDDSEARSALRAGLVTAVEAWPEMASLGAADRLEQRTADRINAFESARFRQGAAMARCTGLTRATTAVALVLIVASTLHQAPVATVVFLGLLSVGVMTAIERLVPAAQAGTSARLAEQRIASPANETDDPTRGLLAAYVDGELAVSDYRLPETPTRDTRCTGFRVAAGGTLLVTGASGSGKTTMLDAVGSALRASGANIVAVGADDFTFTGTVADNIRLAAPDSSDAEIGELLDDMMLNLLPDTAIGVGGRPLSGGEERRLHIARALAAVPDVLIVDEPTSGLDEATATHVMVTMRRRLPNALLAMVMHEPPSAGIKDAFIVSLD